MCKKRINFNIFYTLLGSVHLRVIFNLFYTLLGNVYLSVIFNLFYTLLGSVYLRVIFNLLHTLVSGLGHHAGGVRTPIALHCGSSISNMAMKAVEIGRFWLNIP